MERANFEKWKPKEVARLLALVETERRYYQEIVAGIPVSLLIVGPQLGAVSANRQFRMRLGKRNEEILGMPLADLLKIEGIQPLAEQVVASGVASSKQTMVWEGRPVVVTALPLRNWEEDSDAEALLVIEDQQVDQPVLSPNQQRALDVVNQVEGMLWEVDYASGGLTYVSEGAGPLFGYPLERWLEEPSLWAGRVAEHERQRVESFYAQISASVGQVFSIEFEALHADGHLFWVRESVRPSRNEQGKPLRIVGLTSDVTERRELEQQHSIAVKGEGLQRLSAKLAHDLNNLLMIVAGYGEELKNALPSEHPLHQDMQQILGATERLYSMTTQFQTYTRRPVVSIKTVSFGEFLKRLRPRIEQLLGSSVELQLEVSEGLAPARTDADQTEEAILSLVRHSVAKGQVSGIFKISAANALRSESAGPAYNLQAGAYVRLTLEHANDFQVSELLEPWLSAEEHTREVELGVATAYQILRQSQGDLTVDGCRLHIYIPALSAAEIAAELATETHSPTPARVMEVAHEPETTLETILVVEDEGGIRALVRKILRRQGYNVLEASNGEEALALLNQASEPHSSSSRFTSMDVMNLPVIVTSLVLSWPS